MKTYTITEQQLQEIAGRLNSLNVTGLQNMTMLAGVVAVLEAVAKQTVDFPIT